MSLVFVIMKDDYPQAVCLSEKTAKRRIEAAERAEGGQQPAKKLAKGVVRWRYYPFELDP